MNLIVVCSFINLENDGSIHRDKESLRVLPGPTDVQCNIYSFIFVCDSSCVEGRGEKDICGEGVEYMKKVAEKTH